MDKNYLVLTQTPLQRSAVMMQLTHTTCSRDMFILGDLGSTLQHAICVCSNTTVNGTPKVQQVHSSTMREYVVDSGCRPRQCMPCRVNVLCVVVDVLCLVVETTYLFHLIDMVPAAGLMKWPRTFPLNFLKISNDENVCGRKHYKSQSTFVFCCPPPTCKPSPYSRWVHTTP